MFQINNEIYRFGSSHLISIFIAYVYLNVAKQQILKLKESTKRNG